MCGIFAVLGLKGDPKLNRKRVYNLAKRIRHRGPDSYNIDVRVDEAAGEGEDNEREITRARYPRNTRARPFGVPHVRIAHD